MTKRPSLHLLTIKPWLGFKHCLVNRTIDRNKAEMTAIVTVAIVIPKLRIRLKFNNIIISTEAFNLDLILFDIFIKSPLIIIL